MALVRGGMAVPLRLMTALQGLRIARRLLGVRRLATGKIKNAGYNFFYMERYKRCAYDI